MRLAQAVVISAAAACLAGCASTKEITLLQPVGPAPAGRSQPMTQGSLQVYTAREKAVIDLNMATFFENADFGKNEFLYAPGHTGYTIYTADGKVFKHIRNARDMNDPEPSLVTLPAGSYKVEAQAEIDGSAVTVAFPVTIAPGQNTLAHLDGVWLRRSQFKDNEVVRLPDGQIVGWRAPTTDHLTAQANTSR